MAWSRPKDDSRRMRFTLLKSMPPVLLTLLMLAGCGGGGGSPTSPSTPAPAPSPSPDATIGSAGGTLSVANGAARLVVPAGALAANVGLTLRATTHVPLDPHAVGRSGWELGPAGTTFAVPAQLTLQFDAALGPSGVEPDDLRVHALNGDLWEEASATTAPQGGATTASIAGAGIYGVRWTGPRSACSSAEDDEFDFWLGSWNWTQGSLGGATNQITKEGNGCLIEEHYRDPAGVTGRSVSLLSRIDNQWHQTYIDSQGSRYVLVGERDGRRMVLERASERWVWDPLDPATIHFYAERTSDGGQTWTSLFDGRYTRP